ncbi:MAG: VCBS repeat-containing protein [Thermoanaerobaculia bacterium]|nr:VCBS repeat-containing protein [Thermoanaerobaculia bacterium]
MDETELARQGSSTQDVELWGDGIGCSTFAAAVIAFAIQSVSASVAAEVPFAAPQPIATGQDGPVAVASGDVDGDGDPDLIVLSSEDGAVVWMANDGDCSFVGAQTVTLVAEGGTDVLLADLDGDGDLDLVDQEEADNEVVWWPFDAALGFFLPGGVQLYSGEDADTALAAGDVDGDGDVDLYAADEVIIFLEGVGDGTFLPPVEVATGLDVLELELADLDRDGDLDLLASTLLPTNRVVWFPNQGDGNLAAFVGVGPVAAPGELAPADVDGDGDLDVVSTPLNTAAIAWFENTGAPAVHDWPFHGVVGLPTGARSVHVADMDADGDIDIVSTWADGDEVLWYESVGVGPQWHEHRIDEAAAGARAVLPVDADVDGDIDLIALLFDGDQVRAYENRTIHRNAGAVLPHLMHAAGERPVSMAPADVDGDGDMDALVALSSAADNLLWLENDGSPGLGSWTTHLLGSAFFPVSILSADFDSDLDASVLASGGDIWWLENDGTPGLGLWSAHLIDSGTALSALSQAAVDVDGDGDLDLMTASIDDNELNWFENDGTPAVGAWPAHEIDAGTTLNGSAVEPGDLDRDGDIDVLAISQNGDALYWFENDGTPEVGAWAARLVDLSPGASPRLARVADMDGDGDLDAVAVRSQPFLPGEIHWFENDGTPGNGTWTSHPIGTGDLAGLVCADLDGDGDLDVVATLPDTDRVLWFENDDASGGESWTERVLDEGTMDRPSALAVGDVDDDGDLDAWVAALDSRDVHWLENRGGQVAITTEATTLSGLSDGTRHEIFRATLRHLGRVGDGDAELALLALQLRGDGSSLDAAEAAALLTRLSVWQDADGSGTFDSASDVQLAVLDDFSSITMGGDLVVQIPDGHPDAVIAFDAAPLVVFVVVETTGTASVQGIESLEVTLWIHGTFGDVTVEDRTFDLPLHPQYAPNPAVTLQLGGRPAPRPRCVGRPARPTPQPTPHRQRLRGAG